MSHLYEYRIYLWRPHEEGICVNEIIRTTIKYKKRVVKAKS